MENLNIKQDIQTGRIFLERNLSPARHTLISPAEKAVRNPSPAAGLTPV